MPRVTHVSSPDPDVRVSLKLKEKFKKLKLSVKERSQELTDPESGMSHKPM